MEILHNLKEEVKSDENLTKEIDWYSRIIFLNTGLEHSRCIEIISSNRLYDPILENLFKDFPEKQNEMIKWISNYSAEKSKVPQSPLNKDAQPDEWRKKRNSVFVADINGSRNKMVFIETLIPGNVNRFEKPKLMKSLDSYVI